MSNPVRLVIALMLCGIVVAATLVVVALFLRLLIVADQVRRILRYNARPDFKPTLAEDLPAEFRPRLGELARQLADLGFAAVANVMASDPSGMHTTRCLFVNRISQERASVFCVCGGNSGKLFVYTGFASEFSNGVQIKTHDGPAPSRDSIGDPQKHYFSMPAGTPLKQLYEQHVAHVAASSPPGISRVLPPEGKEIEYVTDLHEVARAVTLPGRGFRLDPTGRFFRPTRRLALKIAAGHCWPFSRIVRWMKRYDDLPGFPVSAPGGQ